MALLSLNTGGSQIDLSCSKATKGTPVFIGETSRAFAGNERNSIRAQKRTWAVTTVPVSSAVEASIQALILNAAQIPCSGDILGATITCSVRCTSSEGVLGLNYFVMQLTVSEV